MLNQNRTRRTTMRMLASILTWALVAGQVVQPVYAVLTPLADVPIAAKVAAKPNIIYTLDDSGSMQLNYIPDYTVSTSAAVSISGLTRTGPLAKATVANTAALFTGQYLNIVGANQPEYNGQYAITITSGTTFTYTIVGAPIFPATGTITYTAGSAYCRGGNNTAGCSATIQGNNTFTSPPFFTADFNRMMYNTFVTYYPPINADGTPVTIAGVTDANGNMGTTVALYAGVQRDVYLQMFGAGVKDNLQTRVAVPLYCNTDWPVTAGTNLAITDVGSLQGQYAAGTGAWCRINGTKYDLSAASGAPAVLENYNYPYQSSSGASGAQYFYRTLGNKALWCDKTSPYWPQVATLTGCGAGTNVYGAATPQTCVKNVNTMSCNPTVGLRNYTPAVCKTDPPAKYCIPGTGGSGSNTPGTGTLPECIACTCNNDYLTLGVNGKCSSTGNVCTSGYGIVGGNLAQCPNIPGALTGCIGGTPQYTYAPAGSASCSSLMWDPVAKTSGVNTLLTDSNGAGVVCRHNNQTYAVSGLPLAGGLFTYSRTNLGDVATANKSVLNGGPGLYNQLGQFTTQAGSGGCPTVGTTINIPRHYYTVDSVQFCDNRINVADDQWRGFGTGVCNPLVASSTPGKNDLTKFKNVKYGQFHRWDLYAAVSGISPIYNPSITFPSGRVWLAASPTPANSESVNYANWYAGYATRLNAAKTTSGAAFANLTAQGTDPIAYRVGFQNLGEELPPNGGGTPIIWVDVKDWDLTQRTAWYSALYGIKVNNFKTPNLSAMLRIGNLVEKGGAGGGDPAVNPLPAGALDPFAKDSSNQPITCTNNYHILFTDGYTNQIAPTSTAGDQDGTTIPTLPPIGVVGVGLDQVVPTLGLGGAWPRPFIQGTPAVANTLSDIATYYWARDLRPTLKDNVPSSSGACKDTINAPCPPAPFQDVDWTKDVAWWQHVNFSALSFGSAGVLDASDQKGTLAAIKSGTQSWPDLTNPWNPTQPLGTGAGAVAVDDLWHAAVMARGSFVYAKNPTEVAYGLASILAGIQNAEKARSAAAFSGQVLDANNNVIFLPTIEPGWSGDLRKIEIDPATGAFVNTWWLANVELAKQIQPAFAGDEPWLSAAKRRVVTLANPSSGGRIPGPGVPFQYASLFAASQGPAMLNSLSSTITQQKQMIAYLRGGSTYGTSPVVTIEGTAIGQFRQRPSAGYNPYPTALGAGLGDITNAQPLILGPPDRGYDKPPGTDPGYNAFVTANAARNTAVVAAANDGMVHVFNAGPMPPAVLTPGGGTELFGFIPRALFRGVAGATATEDVTGIQALTYQDGGVPIYHHHMYVDSSPRSADVDFNNGIGSPNWRTIVVGGLGKGGNSYYALDLTDVSVPDETTAAAKVMWEWTNPDSDVVAGAKLINGGSPGYTFGRPVIVKVREAGYPTGRWVVIVTAGYNNLSGKGKVFFLDAKTGTLLSTITTSAGTTANPSGLAQIHGFVKNQSNQTVEQIYGADLLGNAWRIDVSVADSYKTAPAVLFALLTDKFGVPQPVTTAPQIEIDLNNGIDRYVFFGTGRLLDTSDLTNPVIPQPQTMYAIRDGSLTTILPAGSLPILPRLTLVPTPADGVSPIIGGAPNGWYHDLPSNLADALLGAQRIVVDPTSNVNVAAYVGTKIPDDPCLISLPAFLYARDYTTARSLLETGGGAIVPYFDFSKNGAVGLSFIARTQADGSLSLGILVYGEIPSTQPVDIKNPITGPGIRWSWRLLPGQ